MHHKNIKAEIRRQLKTQYPDWKRLNRKTKKEVARKVLEEVVASYDFDQAVETPLSELIGISGQQQTKGILSIDQMAKFVENQRNGVLFRITEKDRRCPAIKDEELRIVDKLIDDRIVNRLLSYNGYNPSARDLLPSQLLRAELLKTLKYPEISYRKFCGDDKHYKGHKENSPYIGRDNKQNRAFIGLPLHRNQMIHHVQMSQFRSSLTFTQLVNLNVYFLYMLRNEGLLESHKIHFVDSTELAVDRQHLLATVKIGRQKIRIYDDIDCDCGKRRNKRDKSIYVVGYRMHTLTAIAPDTGHCIPLISLLAPANHHDSHFLLPLIQLGQAIGLDVKLVTADEAYHDNAGEVLEKTGVHLITPPNQKTALPHNVDADTLAVTLDDFCEIDMQYIGSDERSHEFKCGAAPGECPRALMCPQFRTIPFDGGRFQSIPHHISEVSQAINVRKHGERPFNLIKKREGLDSSRVRGQHNILVKSTLTTIVTLVLEITGTRTSKKEKKQEQMKLPEAA